MVISQTVQLKIYSVLLFFISYITAFSQENKTIEIPLKYSTAGYAENNSSKGGSTSGKIVLDVLAPSVQAEMGTSETGALTYILPIEVFKGLNNFQPNVALAYNSQSSNGQAGWGWNIVGLSTITMGGKSKEIDGITIGTQYDGKDPYYLDGQRLLKINETTFATEKFSKVKITKPTSGEYQFIVQYTDGKIAKYKELISQQFYISTITDAFNNEIHYSYQVENNVPVVTKISYGGNDIGSDKYFVNFLYKARKRNIQIFRKGISYLTNKVLYEINTSSSDVAVYRKYSLSHDYIEDNSVERLRSVIVSNENGEKLKPLNFNYNTVTQGVIAWGANRWDGINGGATGLGSVTLGNFTKDKYPYPVFQVRHANGYDISDGGTFYGNIDVGTNNSGTSLFSGRVLDLNNRITEKDQLIVVNESSIGNGDYNNPNAGINQQLKDQVVFGIKNIVTGDLRKVSVPVKGGLVEVQNYIAPDPYDPYSQGSYETSYTRDETRREYVQADFNNDGLIDFLIIEPKNLNRGNRIYLAEIGKQNSSTAIDLNPVILSETLPFHGKDIYPVEFDGDGLPELLVVDKYNAKYSVYKINFGTNNLDTLVSNEQLYNFGSKTPLLFGDFNGDGLTDFITPQTVYEIPEDDNSGIKMGDTYYRMQTEGLLWWKYTGNGATFIKNQEDYTEQKIAYLKPSQNNYIKRTTFWQKFWNGQPDSYEFTRYATNNIIITDFNNDGRSDIITINKIGKIKYNVDGKLYGAPVHNLSNTLLRRASALRIEEFYSSLTNRVNFYENKNLQGGTFKQLSTFSIESHEISPLSLITSASSFNYLNIFRAGIDIFDPIVRENRFIGISNDNFLEKQIQEVNNGSSILQKISYESMDFFEGAEANINSAKIAYYYKPQEQLKYPYLVHKANPMLYLVNKIHTVFDDKILTKEYRYENGIQHLEGKGFRGFQKTYASDAYESELKNGKYINKNPVKAVFWNIETRNPEMDNAVVKSTYGGINKFLIENTTLNKRFNKGNHQYLIMPVEESSKDNLKDVVINKKYDYDEADDLKLKNASTDYNGIGYSVSKYTYKPEFSNGDHYFYGKIASVENIVSKDGLSFSSKEESDYFPNGNVSESRKYSNQANMAPVVTSYTYDGIGNLKTQTLSTSGVIPLMTSYEYEGTNRYINKTITPDGLFSTANVNTFGRIVTEASSLGLTTSYNYDTWGNITEITDFLGKKTSIWKSVADVSTGGFYNLHKKREGGVETIVTFDKFDKEIQTKTQSVNSKWVVQKTGYDIFGKKIKSSEPFFEGETIKWNTVEYDELNRPVKNVAFTGKVITTCYEKLKVTVDDGYKKTSKTVDAMGHVIRQQDHGGVLTYSYYPNGALKETNYEGIKTSFEIDAWGNKTKIKDPSAGTFTYEYDNLSRVTKETTPKGYTLYTYDDLGRPLTENTYGNTAAENTNIEKKYTYSGQTKLPETITGTSNGNTFTYTTYYDQYFRIKGKKEETPAFTYTSSTVFDALGRADTVDIATTFSGYNSSSSVKNVYDSNGILIQQNDAVKNTMIWHISSASAKGQTTQMEYGNGYSITNQYNPNDFSLTQIKHRNTSSGASVLDIDYNYDVNKGVLNWRRNNTFDKKEDFTYDKLNRLLTEAVNGVLSNEYTYDKRGRITSNTELGKYNYNETDYKLQSIDFNTAGQNVSAQRGFASIAYNAFKAPININLPGKEDLRFEYNILKTRYSMFSTISRKQKFYTSDFAVEFTKVSNKGGGTAEITTYLTGDPYSANYIKKDYIMLGASIDSSENYFLHRDNLGSILAITKADGTAVEKRFFDAWGNLKALVNEDGEVTTDAVQLASGNLFLDRGYTGHEHLWKTGLINMNARLYDPVLRKFLSPDNLVQDPFNTQSYDRFGYVYNNPLLYVDVDGNEFISLGVAVIIGVAVAITTKAIMNMINGIPFWYGMGKAALMGGVSGAISFGIGSAATSTFGTIVSVGKALFEAGAHALTSGVMASIGGEFGGAAFMSGAISSLMSSGIQALGTNFGLSKTSNKTVYNNFGKEYMKAVMVTTGGLSGGISSTIAGGNFWDGFKQGLITSGLNHFGHLAGEAIEYKNRLAGFLVKNKIMPYDPATIESLKKIIALFTTDGQWVKVADEKTLADWSEGYLKSIVDNNKLLDLIINNTVRNSPAWGITNPINGKIILAPRLLDNIEDNFTAASVIIHEQDHYCNFQMGLLQGNSYIAQEMNELSAYNAAAQWTGFMEKQGYVHAQNVAWFFFNLLHH
ncbi:RHS repeat-associated core domain-containing protein [Chryseobacterium tructae]|uniref:RHS repeat-associated core domain-containing protein n=2 Tax=Chryseobacterium tructae TaxID=1037380 RepID=A0ABV7XQR6_9FLAO